MMHAAARGWSWRMWRWVRRALYWLGVLVVAFIVFSMMWVLSYRYVNPPATPYLLWERQRLGAVDWRWIDIEKVDPRLLRAIVAAEDARFCEHRGVDINAMREAIAEWRRNGELRGGSTISQQTAKNLFLWQERSWMRKGLEAWFTGLMELMLPKERILELYVNVAEFGEGVFGVEAAAQSAFRRSAAEVSLWQAVRLAAVLPAPKQWDAAKLPKTRAARADRRIADGARTLARDGRDDCFLGPP